ncbi:MAG: AMP-dependent synthetase/ligase, partial [Candidatus Bipolaricaulia bacterium]
LKELGIKKGDRVAILAKPRLEWQIALWGALRLGAIVVPVDADLTPPEIGRILEESEAKALIAAGERLGGVKSALPATLEQRISMDQVEGSPNLWELLEGKEPPPAVEVQPEDLALIVYTSGTTGNAKGVMLSHGNLASNVQAFLERLEVSSEDVVLSIIPWHHIFGFTATILGPLAEGAALIYTDDYKSIPKLMLENEVTILIGVPKLFNAMFEHIEERLTKGSLKERLAYRLLPRLAGRKLREKLTGKRFRFFVSGGAPLDPRTIRGLRRLGLGVIEGYGLTETAPVLAFSTPFNRKAGSVGPPIPGVELKILNPNEEGLGEVVVRGPNVMQGYYKNPERTREVLDEEGWFHTGDLGKLDREGWLYLAGRKKNVIVLESGKNVYPEEVEFELGRIPYVEDILVQRGRRQGKEVVQALVYPNWALLKEEEITDLAEIKELLWREISTRCRNLAPYKRIKSREDIIILSEPFEKTSSQDIKRYLYQQEGR